MGQMMIFPSTSTGIKSGLYQEYVKIFPFSYLTS